MLKKLILCLTVFLLFPIVIEASEKEEVVLKKCVDGDTAWFILNSEEVKARFLAIDTPEYTTTTEEYGKEASEFTCNLLTSAHTIEIEFDENSNETDKYGRKLVWVFVNGELLQDLIIEEGLGEVAYLYGDYKYTSILNKSMNEAKLKQLNMWSKTAPINYKYIIGGGAILIFVCIFSKTTRKKVSNKIKSNIKKRIKKSLK